MSARPEFIARDVDGVPAAALIAEPTRAAMITALLDDRPLAAGELARLAGVGPAPASAHLARLEALLARGILTPAPGGGELAACGPDGGAHPEGNGGPGENGSPDGAHAGQAGRHARVAPQAPVRPEAFEVTADGMATLTSFG